MLLSAYDASAQQQGEHVWKDLGRIMNAVACNAASATRTWTASAGQGAGYGLGIFQIDLTRVAATDVGLICYGSLNNGTTWAQLRACSVSSGVCTSSGASWVETVGASTNVLWRVDFLGSPDIKCTFSCTTGGGTDLVSMYGRLSAQ
jgi:hypothetical protein